MFDAGIFHVLARVLDAQAVAPDHEHATRPRREDVGDDAARLVRRAEQAPALA